MEKTPILNNPYEEPDRHYATYDTGELNYEKIQAGRRIFVPDIPVIPVKSKEDRLFDVNDYSAEYGTHIVNLLRKEVGKWRAEQYPGTTRVTGEILHFWFLDPARQIDKRIFFAQREAVETAIWLNEVADRSNPGQHILEKLNHARRISAEQENNLPRTAFKMATGTGKTVVMAMLILYHYFNRQEYRSDTRFADYFLIVAPGITIKNRLGVLYIDLESGRNSTDYYNQRALVPSEWKDRLGNLNARLVITNYHAFELRTLQGNKRSPFDGKLGADGRKQTALEDAALMIRRVAGKMKAGSRLLVLNDEAHHCYLPREEGKNDEDNSKEENERASVWFNGLKEVNRRFKLCSVYDLSATPYYLNGSGYDPYTLFPWVVSDFGLTEAIESGLVKIPFIPESDKTHNIEMPVLRNLYAHVKDELPKKGQRKKKSEDKKEGKGVDGEEPPKLPTILTASLEMFHQHYRNDYERISGLYDSPPVFIVVCNNTSVSKEVYKYLAGFERTLPDGSLAPVPGRYELFSNYRQDGSPVEKPPTLLIDSTALEDADHIDDDFRRVFADEIGQFKREYARIHGQGSAENITEAEILREVVNTVGRKGLLGSHIRCVVSVSMLTEGWDANTVTHVAGIRAFGSQLLCEQVAGRALRRKNYHLQGYDKDGMPTDDKRSIKRYLFPPEYAQIIGIPFKVFRSGSTVTPPDPKPVEQIRALPERQQSCEITFPNIDGYRVESRSAAITADFSGIENYELDGTKLPTGTTMATAFTGHTEELTLDSLREKREQELFYLITKELISRYYQDDNGFPQFQKFNELRRIVEQWYHEKVVLIKVDDPEMKKLLFLEKPETFCSHINRGIRSGSGSSDNVLPVFNHYNPFGSTKHVNGITSKPVYATKKSHVNYVVADTQAWEQIAAKTFEEMDQVVCYVKNEFLGFSIPYVNGGKDRRYFPDFIARCRRPDGAMINLIVEVTGMNTEKAEKKWYVENCWLPAVNAVRDKYGMDEWRFIEIANDIRNIEQQLKVVMGAE